MRRILTLLALALLMGGPAMAQMSDTQVIEYVKRGQAQGKSQQQLVTELGARGVTKDQVERIKKQYDSQNTSSTGVAVDKKQKSREKSLNPDYVEDEITAEAVENASVNASTSKRIFGHNVFNNRNLTFEPNTNTATPENYKLGPGDEVIIDVWGAAENTIRATISPEGSISVSTLGPVYLNGMTVKEANSYLQREFAKIYAGVQGNSSQVKLTLGQIRTIQVNIMGEVAVPGTYRLSAFSSVFHALYRAGGINDIGGLRSIKVMRNGKTAADIDVYDYILHGKMSSNIRLNDNDVIIVAPYDCLVSISGRVKRPMYYEMKRGETLATLLEYSGSFTGDAYTKSVRVLRQSGHEKAIYNVDEMDYSVFKVYDEDSVSVEPVLDRFENRVEVRGAVYRSGMYQINGTVNTIKQLIQKADGLRGDAFLTRAQLRRENEDLTYEMVQIDLKGMMDGTVADMPLQSNDVLYIPSIHDLREQQNVTITGEVLHPDVFTYAKNMTIEDLVMMAGGLTEAASTVRVDITRRVKDPKSETSSNLVGQTFTLELNDGFLIGEDAKFTLEPFDQVYVRRSPGYQAQQNVAIDGEILFRGTYAITNKNFRLSDLVKKAGNLTPDAYVDGARLVRVMNDEERKRRDDVMSLVNTSGGKDTIDTKQLKVDDYYSVGIDLKKALANPKSDYDLVLREGDMLYIPENIGTVKINGAVLYPNTVIYQDGKGLKHFINQAGGFAQNARRKKCFVVYMNGTVSRVKRGQADRIKPGCEIIIPAKNEKSRRSASEILSMSSTATSMAAVIASMINLFK